MTSSRFAGEIDRSSRAQNLTAFRLVGDLAAGIEGQAASMATLVADPVLQADSSLIPPSSRIHCDHRFSPAIPWWDREDEIGKAGQWQTAESNSEP